MTKRSFKMHAAHVAVNRAGAIRRKKIAAEAADEQGNRCVYCGVSFSDKIKPTFEHIVPKSRGGSDTKRNAAASCFRCNQERGTTNHEAFMRYKSRATAPASPTSEGDET